VRHINLKSVPELLRPGQVVYVAGCAGQPDSVLDILRQFPDACAGITFTGVLIPGVNRVDPAALNPTARLRTFFMAPEFRDSFDRGQVDFLPLHYSRIYPYLQSAAGIDLAIFTVSPPGPDGMVTLGVANDFTPAVLSGPARCLAVVNPFMPVTEGGPRWPLSRFDWVVDGPSPLLTLETGDVPDDIAAVGRAVAGLLHDGDTLQLGLGKVQAAVLQAATGLRDLGIHAGMIADPLLPLLDRGVVTRVLTNVALGSVDLYARCSADPRIRFGTVADTHTMEVLSRIERLVSINSVIEVDLFGQANAEMMGSRQVSGHGGLVDFLRGGVASSGGRSILATPATARRGQISRIVPRLEPDTVTTVQRADTDLVVTEFGVADLRFKSVDGRAEALIQIAAPAFRDYLAESWRIMRQRM
jgi:acyl-CoA hydrolase